jgi:hypothetical protein
MINANEDWTAWMRKHWPKATPLEQTLCWELWCKAWTGGRIQERQIAEEKAAEPLAETG